MTDSYEDLKTRLEDAEKKIAQYEKYIADSKRSEFSSSTKDESIKGADLVFGLTKFIAPEEKKFAKRELIIKPKEKKEDDILIEQQYLNTISAIEKETEEIKEKEDSFVKVVPPTEPRKRSKDSTGVKFKINCKCGIYLANTMKHLCPVDLAFHPETLNKCEDHGFIANANIHSYTCKPYDDSKVTFDENYHQCEKCKEDIKIKRINGGIKNERTGEVLYTYDLYDHNCREKQMSAKRRLIRKFKNRKSKKLDWEQWNRNKQDECAMCKIEFKNLKRHQNFCSFRYVSQLKSEFINKGRREAFYKYGDEMGIKDGKTYFKRTMEEEKIFSEMEKNIMNK